MSADKVSKYVRLLNNSLKLRQQGRDKEEDEILDELDLIWFSLNENERTRVQAAVAILRNYY
jgi:hypothetical protein